MQKLDPEVCDFKVGDRVGLHCFYHRSGIDLGEKVLIW